MAGAAPDGPFEGVPAHLKAGLVHWWRSVAESGNGGFFAKERPLRALVAHLRLGINPTGSAGDTGRALINAAMQDDELFLDIIDGTLDIYRTTDSSRVSLANLLDVAGSVWTVAPDGRSLERVVSDEAQATCDAATSVADEATTELREAWANAFGRNGDPSDAWDHAIKAVEDVLIAAMMPKDSSATLGKVVGELAGQNGAQWRILLPGNDQSHDVAPLVAMLRLMWPNHDRHGGPTPKRTPSPEEARAVVTLAATIVQWHREAWVIQKR